MGFFEGLVHPALAWGALLAAVPLVIHLLNRQRHKPMPWAAMRFVLEAYRRTRRRARLESLLLLLLRMAAVALLAFAVARPFAGGESPLAPLTERRRDVVLLLDGSASTGYRENVGSVFEAEVERAREILGELDGTRGDRLRLVLGGARPRLLSARSPEDGLSMLSTLARPRDEPLDLAACLAEIAGDLERELGGRDGEDLELRILSDLQRDTFSLAPAAAPDAPTGGAPTGAELASPLARALDRLVALGVDVVVEDLGAPEPLPANLGVEAIAPLAGVLGPGIPTEIGVRVRNFGGTAKEAVRVSLAVDGERLPVQEVTLGPRAALEVPFSIVFSQGGEHVLEAQIEGDRLAVDDRRAQVLHVPPPARVLLVNGAPQDDVARDELGLLRVVLEPTDDGGTLGAGYVPFAVETRTLSQLAGTEEDFAGQDVVVLANTGAVSRRVADALERRVAGGAGLVITLGDRTTQPEAIEAFNARLWRADGSGLSPARLLVAHVSESRDSYSRASTFQADHPALAFFADERWRPLFTEVPIRGFVASEPAPHARVLAALDDPAASPLLVERDFDRGRVFLWTTTIDADWTRLPESPASFVPLVHELLRYAGRGPLERRNAAVGETLQPVLSTFPRSPVLLAPDGSRQSVDGEPQEIADGVWRLGPLGPLEEVGTWTLETQDGAGLPIAVQLDPREGDLARMSPAELEAQHAGWHVRGDERDERGDDQALAGRGELWRWFAGAALAALVLETLWAAWIGHGRRKA